MTQDEYQLSSHVPVEIRSYEKTGACMAWHVDDVLYEPAQIEIVWTLENTSDCKTLFKANDIESIETEPNSCLLLRAGGPEHCVTSLKRGRRIILKCVYVRKGATYRGIMNGQFATTILDKRKGRKKKRR